MLTVLVVIPTGRVFGLQNAALSFFEHLDRKAFSPFFVVSHWNDGNFIARLKRLDYPFVLVYLGFLSKQLRWDALYMTLVCVLRWPQLCWTMLRLMRRHRFQLIYITSHHLVAQLFPLLLWWRKPVLWHVHDPSPSTFFHRTLYRLLDRVVTRYVVISDSVGERLQALGVPGRKIDRIYDGIDTSIYETGVPRPDVFRRRFGWPATTRIVAMTGQMIERKGHLDFIESAGLIDRSRDVKFLIVGDGEGDYQALLRRRVADLCLDDRVVFSGWETSAADVFRSIDVLVMPSRHEEGFGLVVAEAMAAGKPVVITRSGGAVELVRDGQDGFVVDRGQPAALAEAIRRLLDEPDLARLMGETGCQRAQSQFDIRGQARLLGDCLRAVAGAPRS